MYEWDLIVRHDEDDGDDEDEDDDDDDDVQMMKTYSWALNYLCVKRASTYAITMPNIGLYIRLMPMKL